MRTFNEILNAMSETCKAKIQIRTYELLLVTELEDFSGDIQDISES